MYPALDAVRLSVVDSRGYGSERFVGAANYLRLLADGGALHAVANSFVFGAVATAGTVGIGTAIAMALDRSIPGTRMFRFVIFIPVLLPSTFISLVWRHGLDPYLGWANSLLAHADSGLGRAWLGDPELALFVVATVAVVQGAGLPMVLVLAALADIPIGVHEAATLDGASPLQRARLISWPLVRPVVAAVALLQFLSTYAVFDYVFVMTRGGPGTASDAVSTFVYRAAFSDGEFGYAAAVAVASSVLLMAIALVALRVMRRRTVQRHARATAFK